MIYSLNAAIRFWAESFLNWRRNDQSNISNEGNTFSQCPFFELYIKRMKSRYPHSKETKKKKRFKMYPVNFTVVDFTFTVSLWLSMVHVVKYRKFQVHVFTRSGFFVVSKKVKMFFLEKRTGFFKIPLEVALRFFPGAKLNLYFNGVNGFPHT